MKLMRALLLLCLLAGGAGLVAERSTPAQAEPLSGTSRFVPVPPARVLDTRTGVGSTGRLAPGSRRELTVVGRGGVPETGVVAVVLNVTIVEADGPGFVQVLPTGRAELGAFSNLNVERAGQTLPNSVIVPVGEAGQVSIYTVGGGHVLVDVFGYFTAADSAASGRYVAVTPRRALDTRSQEPGKLLAGQTVRVPMAGRYGVPAGGAAAVVLNVTATEATAAGFVQVVPTGGAAAIGASSNLNVEAGQTIPNQVIVPLGRDGSITVFSEAGTHLLIDVFGYFTDASAPTSTAGLFVPIRPERLLDSRSGARPDPDGLTRLDALGRAGIPASGVAAVIGNLTATESTGAGYLQLVPDPGQSAPVGAYSNVNIEAPNQTIANAAIANIGAGGTSFVHVSVPTHVLFDAGGYFSADAVPPPTTAPPTTAPPTTVPPGSGVNGVVGLHGQSGGPNPSVGFGSGAGYDAPGANFESRTTQGPVVVGDGGYDWSYDTEAGYQASLAAVRAASVGLTRIIIHGYSSGGAMAIAMYARGETFEGRIIGYIIDDPGYFPGAIGPLAGVNRALYGTRNAENTNWNVNELAPDGYMQQLAAALGVSPIVNTGFTTHHPISNPPELAAWFG